MEVIGKLMREVSSKIGRRLTQLEVSKACGVTQGHFSNVVLGKQPASHDLLHKISTYLSSVDSSRTYTVEDFIGENVATTKVARTVNQPAKPVTPIKLGQDFVSLPEVAAVPGGRFEDISSNEVKEWHLIPRSLVGSAKIIVKAVGDSMAPMIQPDDLLLVEEVESSAVKTDDVVIVDIDNELGCKRIARNDEAVVLLSDNPAHRPIHVNGGQTVKVVGRVVGLHRKF